MRRALYSLPLAVLLIANVVPSKAQTVEPTAAPAEAAAAAAAEADADADAGEGGKLVYYDLQRNFSFACSLANPTKLPYVWSKNNTAITELPELRERYKLLEGGAVLELPRAGEDDWGNYSCAVGKEAQAWRLHARVYTRLPSANTNVVEGQKLRLTCRVVGRPAPRVQWTYNATEGADGGPAVDVLGADRVSLRDSDAGVQDGELLLDAARRADAGRYTCSALAPAAALAALAPAHTTLRVKDMYAALWPFLGICAEVLVLCAVILVYEKRRTKPELDDSDTDNHDQKKS